MVLRFNDNELPQGIGVIGWVVSTPAVLPRTIDVPGARGMLRTGRKLGERSVLLRLVLLGDSVAANIAAIDALNAWCYTSEPQPLFLPGRDDRYLLAECDCYAPPDISMPGEEFTITFICHTPEYIDDAEMSGSGVFEVGGVLDTPVRLETVLATAIADPVWMIDATAHVIRLSGAVGPGKLIIDTELGKITVDGDDITDQATLESDLYVRMMPGKHTVSAPPSVTTRAYWRERWM